MTERKDYVFEQVPPESVDTNEELQTHQNTSPVVSNHDKHIPPSVKMPSCSVVINGSVGTFVDRSKCVNIDASVHVEQTTVNHTVSHKSAAIGVGDETIKGVLGAVAGFAGLLKG